MIAHVLECGASGEMLTWQEENLVVSGLPVLAEAKRSDVFRPLLAFLKSDPVTVESVFGEDFMWLGELLFTLADDDAGLLQAFAGDADVPAEARTAALGALATLVLDGRADRDALVRMLDAVDRDPGAVEDPALWWMWTDAIAALRLREFIPRVRRAVDDGYLYGHREVDWVHWLGLFEQPEPYRPVRCVTDAMMCLQAFAESEEPEPLRVPAQALSWLERALRRQPETISFERIDGFLTAALCGPEPQPGAAAVILETWTGMPRAEVRQEALRLLRARFAEIKDRLSSGVPLAPFLEKLPGTGRGELWASGFLERISEMPEQWKRLMQHAVGPALMTPVLGLAGLRRTSDDLREDICERLGEFVLDIRGFWTDGAPRWAIAAMRPGRNDPCPCGSGRKFKKCCATAGARLAEAVV